MENRRVLHSTSRLLIICAAVVFLTTITSAASTPKIIYQFAGGPDGEYLDTELVMDSTGNLYGTTVQGGQGSGTIFRVTPAGDHTVLYSFSGGADGAEPYKGVTIDAQGNLYGTTVAGGGGSCEGGCGVVYKLTNSGGTWTQSVIYTFSGGNDGAEPGSPMAFDQHGSLYGTTVLGGAHGAGVVYQLEPDGSGGWKFKVLHAFTGGADGAGGSAGRPLITPGGRIYGTCTTGGAHGSGIVYEMFREQGRWQFKTLYAFKDQPDGAFPYSALILDKHGNLYGTTYYAGADDWGTVYKLSYKHGTWSETVLYSFKGGTDGASPISSLVADAAGNLYGTTSDGGRSFGVIFKLTAGVNGSWTESVVYRFPGAPGLGVAYNGMVGDSTGHFYGATVHGGRTDDGAIYRFTP
jgi:uncharacterized repeat protein (TIGR03803 family)